MMKNHLKAIVLFSSILMLLPISGFTLKSGQANISDESPDIYPEIILQVKPDYPASAQLERIQGKVYINAFISKLGFVDKAEIQKSSGHTELDNAALDAVKLFLFNPGYRNDEPIACRVTIPIEFKLENTDQEKSSIIDTDNLPEFTYQKTPEYPQLAREQEIEGDVWVKAFISESGTVTKAEISKSSLCSCGFDESALKAAYQNRFKPVLKDGKPVSLWITYKVAFRLN